MYQINGKIYKLKDKYTLKEWGKILKLLMNINNNDLQTSMIILLENNLLIELLNIILDNNIEEEIYEEDFETITKIINDFFSRKNSLMKNYIPNS